MRTDTGTWECDLLVVGAGIAGMTAAARAASLGLETVVAGSAGTLAFYSGLMDYLGCWPPGNPHMVQVPEEGVTRLLTEMPDHPYAIAAWAASAAAGPDKIREGFEFVAGVLNRQGLAYSLPSGKNIFVITAMGTVKPSFLVPRTMTVEGEGVPDRLDREKGGLVIAGIQGLPGFSPSQVCYGLGEERAIPVRVSLPGTRGMIPPQVAAGQMADPRIREIWTDQVRPHAAGAWACGVPAVFGLGDHQEIVDEISASLGCPLFEIPGAPPSMPGLRLKQAFESYLQSSGVRVLSNTRMADPVFDGKRFTLTAKVEPRGRKILARGVVLATGRFFGRGLHARRERIVEPLFHLDVSQPVRRSLWHNPRFLDPGGHGINRAGLETDRSFRPLDERGRPVYRHLYAAGGILANNDWSRLKSGAGVSILSAVTAVDTFFREAGHGR